MTELLTRIFRGKEKTEQLPPALDRHLGVRGRIDLSTPVADADFTVFDTELTGLDFRRDSIISVGAVKMKGGKILLGETFYRLVRPESELKGDSVVVHGITHSDLEDAERAAPVMEEFVDFVGDSVLVGHFVFIDLNFVNRALKQAFGYTLRSPAVDTSSLHDWLYENDSAFARHYRGMTLKKDLFSMARKYGIEVSETHNAFYDAYITAQLFQRFINFLPGCGIRTLGELLAVGKA